MSKTDELYKLKMESSHRDIYRAYALKLDIRVAESKISELAECSVKEVIGIKLLTEVLIDLAEKSIKKFEKNGVKARMVKFKEIDDHIKDLKRADSIREKESKAISQKSERKQFREKMRKILDRAIQIHGVEETINYYIKWRDINAGVEGLFTFVPSDETELWASMSIEYALNDLLASKGSLDGALLILKNRIAADISA